MPFGKMPCFNIPSICPAPEITGDHIQPDGQHVVIRGSDELSGCEVDGCDIRAAAALTIAGLRADGETLVTDAHHVDRGYQDFVPKLASLGADITRV